MGLSVPGPVNTPLDNLRQAPTLWHGYWELHRGPVSSFHLEDRVSPVTVAHDGSSVTEEVSPHWRPLPPGSGGGPLAWLWHRQRLGHACPCTIWGVQAQSTSSRTHMCSYVSRAQGCSAQQCKFHGPGPPSGRRPWLEGTCIHLKRCVCPSLLVPAKGSSPCGPSGHNL